MKHLKTLVALAIALTLALVLTASAEELPAPGYSIAPNTDFPVSDAAYQVTFTYQASSADVQSVSLVGNWTFYTEDEANVLADGKNIPYYTPFQYKNGMFNTGYSVAVVGGGYAPIEMTKVADGLFQTTVPLPGNEYFYGFAENGDLGNIAKDPANMPVANDGSDSGWSLIWVGEAATAIEGQEYIFARTDEKVGTVSFGEYTAEDGSTQPYGIYLPHSYDPANTYKVLYISHGGGGNEVEWMYIGSAANIFDNLIAEGKLEPTVIVTMDNVYFGFDPARVDKNMRECLIPAIEANYSVARERESRAFAGLSMGGYATTVEVVEAADTYDYFGIFSPNFRALPYIEAATDEQKAAMAGIALVYESCGIVDNGMGSQDRLGTVQGVYKQLQDNGANVVLEWKKGAHDWGVWRAQLTTFAKDYLWKTNVKLGTSEAANTDFPESEAEYQVTFTYRAQKELANVQLVGPLQFYTADQEAAYVAGEEVPFTDVYHYKKGMFNTGYVVTPMGYNMIDMENIGDNTWQVTIPLPATEYFYKFNLVDDKGNAEMVYDPTNRPFTYRASDAGWSLVWVGDGEHAIAGQEKIYPRTDDQVGTLSFINYTAIDGTSQPAGVYLPYGYDEARTYKTLYLSHGGGGNEVEWFYIGAAKNIMDNLIAEGKVEPMVVVTMDNTYFNFEKGASVESIVKCLIPYIEANYAVAKNPEDRAMAGLSSGASVTVHALLSAVDEFGYYGIWSPSRTMNFVQETLTDEMKAGFQKPKYIYVSVGIFDSEVRRSVNTQIDQVLSEEGIENHTFVWKLGAHDWGVWRDQMTEFVGEYLWK